VLLEDFQEIRQLDRLPLEVIIRGLEAQLAVTPKDEYYRSYLVYAYYEAFKKNLNGKNYETAEEFLEKAGKIFKDHRYHFYKALLLKELGDLEGAEIELRNSIGLKEDFYLGYYELGNLLKEKAEYEDALTAFSNSIKFMPTFVLPYLKIADIYMEKGILSSAKLFLEKILEIDEEFVEAHLRLGVLYNIEQKYSKAVKHFKKASKLSPDRWEARYNLAFSLSRLGKYFEAINELKEILKIGIDEPYIYNELALLCKNVGLYDEASENIKNAISKTENWEYLLNGAKISLLLDNFENSLDYIIRSIEMAENKNQELLSKYWLSRIYLEFNEFSESLKVIQNITATSLKVQALENFLKSAVKVYPDTSVLLENFEDILEVIDENSNIDLLTFANFVKDNIELDRRTEENLTYLIENSSFNPQTDQKGSCDIFPVLLDIMVFFGHRFAAIERNLTKIVMAFHLSSESLAASRLLLRIYEYIFMGQDIQIPELLDEVIPELQDLNWNFALKISTISKLQEREEHQLLHELVEKGVKEDLFHFMRALIITLAVDKDLENIRLIRNQKLKNLLLKIKQLKIWARKFTLK